MSTDTNPSRVRQPRTGVSRRTLVAGTAWAVPAVVVATAAPAAAASCALTFTITAACRVKDPQYPTIPGLYTGYRITLTVTKSATCPANVGLEVTVGGASQTYQLGLNTLTASGSFFVATTQKLSAISVSYASYFPDTPGGNLTVTFPATTPDC